MLFRSLLSGTYKADEVPDESTLWGSRRKGTIGRYMQGRAGKVIATVEEVAADLGVSMPQVAMAWVMSHPEITVAISGADTIEQMRDVVGAMDVELSGDVIAHLDYVSAGMRAVLDGNPTDIPEDLD